MLTGCCVKPEKLGDIDSAYATVNDSVQKPNAKPKNNVSSTCARPKGKRNIEDFKLEFN